MPSSAQLKLASSKWLVGSYVTNWIQVELHKKLSRVGVGGLAENKANSAPIELELELGLSLAKSLR